MGEVQLIEAVKAGNLSAVATLLASGGDIHQQDEHGWASLHWAAGKGDAAVVGLLLQHGANALQVGRDQRTPYMIALAAARIEAAQLLREAEAKAGSAQHQHQQPRQYCKAYYLKDLRRFSGWSESPAEGGDGDYIPDDDVVFLHQDLTVTASMWHNENVLFNQKMPEWENFCVEVLQFQVPDDFDLIPGGMP